MLGREVYVYDPSRMLVFEADLAGLEPDFSSDGRLHCTGHW
jgi:hypothetical protein